MASDNTHPYRAFLALVDKHSDHNDDSCDALHDESKGQSCPCFPLGLKEGSTEDYCRFFSVTRCPSSATLLERFWCNNGRTFEGAIRASLI